MNITATEIERIVREVLAELGDGAPIRLADSTSRPAADSTSAQAVPARLAADGTSAPAKPQPTPGEVVVQSRVVTLAELDGRLGSARRVIVPAGAVVTPAVRDELLRRNIALSFAAAGNGKSPGEFRLVAYILGRKYDPAPLRSALESSGIGLRTSRSDCLIASTEALADEINTPETLGLLLTRHTAAGLCLANRHAGVRAIYGCSPDGVAVGAESVGANLLVASTAAPLFTLRQMVLAFTRGGVKQCPEAFKKQLA